MKAIVLAIVVIAASSSSAALKQPRLTASPAAVTAAANVTVRGSGWTQPGRGCAPGVHLEAYVRGVSPYRAIALGRIRVHNGTFTVKWRTPRVVDRLRWEILARQRCPHASRYALAYVLIAPVRKRR